MREIRNLLVELCVEELPPKALKSLGDAFAEGVFAALARQGLTTADSVATAYASPRRLAVHIRAVPARAADQARTQKLMPLAVAFTADGSPTPALQKKLAALGLDMSVLPTLRRAMDGKTEALYHDSVVSGATLAEGLQKALDEMLARLPIPKVMSYQLDDGWSTVHFVRPAHALVALHGDAVVPVSVLGLRAGRHTFGHRFEAAASPLPVRDADSYEAQLEAEGAVIPSFAKRRAEIARQLAQAAARLGGAAGVLRPIEDDALLDEVTALVERPNVLACQFEPEFLAVPQECLILTMKANQKYFPLLDANGRLTHHFLVVANVRPSEPAQIIAGNERVVRPRLADARFFFEQDRKTPLAERIPRLDAVVYHNRLGSQGQRVRRLVKLAGAIAAELGAPVALAERAAYLAKADLATDMVGEFPELQGVMGRYYALADGEDALVAQAIAEHYRPRFAGDALPEGPVAVAVALADKLDALVGIFGIGLAPSGDKDPYALRRAALGVLRILMEQGLSLDLMRLLELARGGFEGESLNDGAVLDVFQFMLDRLRVLLREQGYGAGEVGAVLAGAPRRIDQVRPRIEAVRAFRARPEAEALAAAHKRIRNLLRKGAAADSVERIDPALLQAGAEAELYAALRALEPSVEEALIRFDYAGALHLLAGLRGAVDRFFDEVMVLVDDARVRANRLALLSRLAAVMNAVADLGELA